MREPFELRVGSQTCGDELRGREWKCKDQRLNASLLTLGDRGDSSRSHGSDGLDLTDIPGSRVNMAGP